MADAPPPEIRRLPHEVVTGFVDHAAELMRLGTLRLLLLAIAAGSFIAIGAMISVTLSLSIQQAGLQRLLLGVGFASGFILVVISGSALITEVNVMLPELRFAHRFAATAAHARFWAIVLLGNIIGALFVGALFELGDVVGPAEFGRLSQLIGEKMRFQDDGGRGWIAVVASGVAGNWLVGMATFLATAARTISGKILGILFPVVGFVALGLQYAPANLGYFSIAQWHGDLGYSWPELVVWNLVPALLGNIIGAATLVAALFWFTHGRPEDRTSA
jgi:formate transporter